MNISPTNRTRAESFGSRAEQYDRARPDYPPELFDDLVDDEVRSVLDVGCGTGKAARAYIQRGCDVLGVEVDPRMADVARRHGVSVEVARFEEWNDNGRRFDLVSCAQAWHWIDPDLGYAQMAAVLRSDGRAATFWNLMVVDQEPRSAMSEVYERLAPELAGETGLLRGVHRPPELASNFVDWPEWFVADEVRSIDRSIRYSTDEWLDQIPTHSDHGTFDPSRLRVLLDGLRVTIDGLGGVVPVTMRTVIASAVRR